MAVTAVKFIISTTALIPNMCLICSKTEKSEFVFIMKKIKCELALKLFVFAQN